MKTIELSYNTLDDFTEFPYKGELTSDNINTFPEQIASDVLELKAYVEKSFNNFFAFLGTAGDYSSDAIYNKYDLVNSNGQVYISLVDNNTGNAVTDTAWWASFSPSLVNNRSAITSTLEIEASDGQTEIDGSFDPVYTDVYVNGIKYSNPDEYTIADDGSSVTMADALNDGDKVQIVSWNIGSILDVYNVKKVFSSAQVKPGDFVVIDTSTNDVTMTLPVRPRDGSIIRMVDKTGNAQDHPVTVTGAGASINGSDEDVSLDVNNFAVDLVYDYIKNDWTLAAQ